MIQVMQSLYPLDETLGRLLFILFVSVPVLVFISALSGYYLAARALSPIDQIIRKTQRISAEDLSTRLNLPIIDDEVGRLAATLDQMLARLEDAFIRARQFTADASHELRTPLTATQTIINVIREKQRSPEEYEKALDDIAEETGRLRTITENLLFIARGDARQMNNLETINLSDLLENVAESIKPMATNKGLDFQWNVPDGLYIEGDNDALIRLLVNLVDNAIKYTDQGSIKLHANRSSSDEIQVHIQDTGKGIPTEYLHHIFERFYRLETSRTTMGSGLGLAIAQEIVNAHHGRIEVTSQVGKGTCFIMTFPGKQGTKSDK